MTSMFRVDGVSGVALATTDNVLHFNSHAGPKIILLHFVLHVSLSQVTR